MGWIADQWEQMRGNIKWDLFKAVGAVVLGAAYVILQKLRHLAWDWYVFGGILVISLLLLLLNQNQRMWQPVRPKEDPFQHPQWQVVTDVVFRNTLVPVDGKRFYKCTFDNVTFRFEGTGPTEMIGCQTNGVLAAESSHPIARAYSHLWYLLSSFPGGQVKFSTFDEEGHARPSFLRVSEILPPANLSLSARAFALCKEMRSYLKEVGTEPQYNGSGSSQDFAKWLSDVVLPWQERFHAGYMLRFHARLVAIRHELVEKGLRDGEIDSFIGSDVHNDRMLKQMIEALIMLAAKLDD